MPFRLVPLVDDHHPTPGAEHEATTIKAPAFECGAELRKVTEGTNRAREAFDGVSGKAVSDAEARESICGRRADDDARHALQLFDRNPLALGDLLSCRPEPLYGTGNTVQDLDHRPPVDLGIVDRTGE